MFLLLLCLVTFNNVIDDVMGHGGMLEPPMRSLAWRYGFDVPINYDWMSLYCGGFHEFKRNNGRCGVCGDPSNGPFLNEKGGVYDTGIIVRHYPASKREIEVKVEITAHHKGFFQFKICPNNREDVTQECLDRNVLVIREGDEHDPTKYYPPKEPKLNELHVRLPPSMICDRCVLQWTYTAGNNVGRSRTTGEMCLGCGMQETFVNCADISIGGTVDSINVDSQGTREPEVVINQLDDVNDIIDTVSPNVEGDVMFHENHHRNNIQEPRVQNHNLVDAGFNMNVQRPSMPIPSPINPGTNMQPISRPSFSRPHFNGHGSMDTHRSIFSPRQPPISSFQTPGIFDNQLQTGLPGSGLVSQQQTRHFVPQPPSQNWLPPPSQISLPLPSDINSLSRGQDMTSRTQDMTSHTQDMTSRSQGMTPEFGSHSLLGSVRNAVQSINGRNAIPQFSHSSHQRHMTSGPRFQSNREIIDHHRNYPQRIVPHSSNVLQNTQRNFHPSVLAAIRHSRENWLSGQQSQLRRHKLLVNQQQTRVAHPQTHITHQHTRVAHPQTHVAHQHTRVAHPQTQVANLQTHVAHQHTRVANPQTRVSNQHTRVVHRQRTSLPRRIIVHSTEIAQHLLAKYPQFKGRVYLSRQAHAKSKYARTIQHRYAKRRTMYID